MAGIKRSRACTPVARRAMNDGARLGGWEQSSLRAWMADELPELLPSELVSNVVALTS